MVNHSQITVTSHETSHEQVHNTHAVHALAVLASLKYPALIQAESVTDKLVGKYLYIKLVGIYQIEVVYQ